MTTSIVISAVELELAGGDSLPTHPQEIDNSLGNFSLVRLDRTAFEAHRSAKRLRHTSVSFRMSQLVSRLLTQAGLSPEKIVGAQTGLVSGSRYGCSTVFDMHRRLARYGPRGIDAVGFAQATHNFPVSSCAIEFGFKGPCTALVSSHAAGMEALQCATDWLLDQRCERVIVTAFEDFASPIDDHIRMSTWQNGPVREAMVCLLLEDRRAAHSRGSSGLAELTGTALLNRGTHPGNSLGLRIFGRDIDQIGFAVNRSPKELRDCWKSAAYLNAGECIGAGGLVELAQLLERHDHSTDRARPQTPRDWIVGACDPATGGIAAGIRLH